MPDAAPDAPQTAAGRAPLPPGFLLRHGVIPLAVFAVVVAVIQFLDIVWRLSTQLYALDGGT